MDGKKSKVQNENYVVVQGWMVNELGLKGNSLLIFAIIYGFTQTDNQKFAGSIQYLMDWTNASRRTVIYSLNELVENKLLDKEEKIINNIKICEYKALKKDSEEIAQVVQKLHGGSAKISQEVVQKLHGGSAKIAPNNIDNNLYDNKLNNNIDDSFTIDDEFEELWAIYPNKKGKTKALKHYIKARTRKKNPVKFDTVLNAIVDYNKFIKDSNTPAQYIKHGSTWFHNECWNDDYTVARNSNGKIERKLPDWYANPDEEEFEKASEEDIAEFKKLLEELR